MLNEKKNNSYEFLLKRYYKRSSWILNREMFLLDFFFNKSHFLRNKCYFLTFLLVSSFLYAVEKDI